MSKSGNKGSRILNPRKLVALLDSMGSVVNLWPADDYLEPFRKEGSFNERINGYWRSTGRYLEGALPKGGACDPAAGTPSKANVRFASARQISTRNPLDDVRRSVD